MPNWVTHRVTVAGDEGRLREFRESMFDDEGVIQFEALAPMPAILDRIIVGVVSDRVLYMLRGEYARAGVPEAYCHSFAGAMNWARSADSELAEQVGLTCRAKRETGFPNWYVWAKNRWGCKWPAHDGGIREDLGAEGGRHMAFYFDTPNDMADGFLQRLGEAYPDLFFSFVVVDASTPFAASGIIDQGQLCYGFADDLEEFDAISDRLYD